MKILDENNVELPSPDLSKGRLVEEQLFISHHPAVEAVPEQWHYETIAEYPNGGKDVKKIVDIPGVEAQDAASYHDSVLDQCADPSLRLDHRIPQQRCVG